MQGKTFDDVRAEHESRGLPFKFAERKRRSKEKESREGMGNFGAEDSERAQPQRSPTAGSEAERRGPELSLPVDTRKEEV